MCIGIVCDFPEEDIKVLLEDLEKEEATEEENIERVNHDIGLVYNNIY